MSTKMTNAMIYKHLFDNNIGSPATRMSDGDKYDRFPADKVGEVVQILPPDPNLPPETEHGYRPFRFQVKFPDGKIETASIHAFWTYGIGQTANLEGFKENLYVEKGA